jgi:hypothetical protein
MSTALFSSGGKPKTNGAVDLGRVKVCLGTDVTGYSRIPSFSGTKVAN